MEPSFVWGNFKQDIITRQETEDELDPCEIDLKKAK